MVKHISKQQQTHPPNYFTDGYETSNPISVPLIIPLGSYRTLGVFISPSGSTKHAYNILSSYSLEYASTVTSSTFNKEEQNAISCLKFSVTKITQKSSELIEKFISNLPLLIGSFTSFFHLPFHQYGKWIIQGWLTSLWKLFHQNFKFYGSSGLCPCC
jgi:hypothetical protein